jgi:hypothetical protein
LCNQVRFQVHHNPQEKYQLSDHDLLITHIPITSLPLLPYPTATQAASKPEVTTTTPKMALANATTTAPPTGADTENVAATAGAAASAPSAKYGYSWQTGDCLANYCTNAKIWAEYTSTEAFTAAFSAIIEEPGISNDDRDTKVESFLIEEATKAGVLNVTAPRRPFTNPNKWDKHMAPWFTVKCQESKRAYRNTKKKYGKKNVHTIHALYTFI